jgi:transglutaminase-like putative cysteine protease
MNSWLHLPRWPGWNRLPREARDTLFLLAVIAWTVLPHVSHLPLWCSLLTAAVLLWRARLALDNAPLPSRWVLVGVLMLAALLTLWSFRTLLGKEPGVTMAVTLMALKTLELRARRDAFVVFFLGFFIILTHFLYSQSLPVAAAMLVSVWGLLTALVLAHMPVGQPSLRQAAKLSARTALLGAPIMALMFVLFPRIGPLWGVPQDGKASTGLSNSMTMGSVSEVALDESVALRVRFEGPPPPAETLYFRGPVLARFDGREWRPHTPRFPAALQARANLRVSGPVLRYEMTLEPLRLATLPLLEATPVGPTIEGLRVSQRDDLSWQAERPVFERLRLRTEAYTTFRHGPVNGVLGLQDFLELPPGFNPRALAWAADLRRDPRYAQAGAQVLAQALMQHIRSAPFSYTLNAGSYGRDAIDEFWFDRREGFCEHYAAAFVVLMRALDVPARVVTGYQGAEPVPVDGYYLVRQSSAHAWAEYWQADRPAGFAGRHAGHRQPGPAGEFARRLGGHQQPLEPVGAELRTRPAARRAQRPGLRFTQLGRPVPGVDRHTEHTGTGRRRLGLVGPSPHRPLGAPDGPPAARAAPPGPAGRNPRGAPCAGSARARGLRQRRRSAGIAAGHAGAAALQHADRAAARCGADTPLRGAGAATGATRPLNGGRCGMPDSRVCLVVLPRCRSRCRTVFRPACRQVSTPPCSCSRRSPWRSPPTRRGPGNARATPWPRPRYRTASPTSSPTACATT